MNLKKIIPVALMFFLFKISSAQILFQKTFGGTGSEWANSILQTTDGGYVIAGATNSFGAGSFDFYLIRTDVNGDSLWVKTYGGSSDDIAYTVCETTDGGFMITGTTESFGAGNRDILVIKTDANGDTLLTTTFGGIMDDFSNIIFMTNDGGYMIAGTTYNFGAGIDMYLIKIDANGDSLWTKTFGCGISDKGYSALQTMDGGYVIAGSSFNGASNDCYLIKSDASGNLLWSKSFGGITDDQAYSVLQTADSGFTICGFTASFGAGGRDIYLIRTDKNGDLLWTRTYGGQHLDEGQSIQKTFDGGFIVAGFTVSFGASNEEIYLVRTNAFGDTLWTRTLGGFDPEEANSIQKTFDGGFIIAGLAQSFGMGNLDVYIIKTDSLGTFGCNAGNPASIVTTPSTIESSPTTMISSGGTVTTSAITVSVGGSPVTQCSSSGLQSLNSNPEEVFIYPNPFYNDLKISSNKNGEFILFDVTGNEILRQRSLAGETNLNTIKLGAGIYILRYIEENKIMNIKLTKM